MIDLLDDFETYFATLGLLDDFTVYKDTTLDEVPKAITIFEYAGGSLVPNGITGLRSVQITARSFDPMEAKEKAYALFKALQVPNGIIHLTPTRWGQLTLRQVPFKIKVDAEGKHTYGFNLGINTYQD